MTVKKGNTSTTNAEPTTAIKAAEKSGKTWAQLFLHGSNKEEFGSGSDLRAMIEDAETLFKGKPDELDAFYDAIGRASRHDQQIDHIRELTAIHAHMSALALAVAEAGADAFRDDELSAIVFDLDERLMHVRDVIAGKAVHHD